MALSLPHIDDQAPSSRNDSDDEVDLLAIDFFGEDRGAGTFAPALTDKLHIGVLTSDQYTQTRDNEILDIKRVTDTVRGLHKEMVEAKHELKFIEQVMSASFEDKIEVKAFQLQSRLMERMQNLQKLHEDRVAVVRRSFKQQLQDALVTVSAQYKNYYEGRLTALRSDSSGDEKSKQLVRILQLELQNARLKSEEKDQEITMLKEDLMSVTVSQDNLDDDVGDPAMDLLIEGKDQQLDEATRKLRAVKGDMEELKREFNQLNLTVRTKDQQLKELRQDVADLNKKLEKEKSMKKLEAPKPEPPSQPKTTPQYARTKSIGRTSEANEIAEERKISEELRRELYNIQKNIDEQIEEAVFAERKKHSITTMELQNAVEELREQVELGRSARGDAIKDAEREAVARERLRWMATQRRWEKKFQILRASLHAIKDEAFIRGQLQKQTMRIKYASVSYGPDNENLSPERIASPALQGFEPVRGSSRILRRMEPTPSQIFVNELGDAQRSVSGFGEEEAFYKDDQDPIDDDDGFARLVPLPDKPNFGSYMQLSSPNV